MFVVCVEFQVHQGCVEEFMPLMQQQADNSLSLEQDCLRFDVLRNSATPDVVFLYEIYASQDAFKVHLESDHFKTFDSAVAELVQSKQVSTYDQLYAPSDAKTD